VNGPAIEWSNNGAMVHVISFTVKMVLQLNGPMVLNGGISNGKLHREDGPAVDEAAL